MQQLIGFWFILNYNLKLINTISTDGARFASSDESSSGTKPTILWNHQSNIISSSSISYLSVNILREEKSAYQSVYWRYDWLPYEPKYTGVDVEFAVQGVLFSKNILKVTENRCLRWMGRVDENLAKVSPLPTVVYSQVAYSSINTPN